jgi:hypothetical protein
MYVQGSGGSPVFRVLVFAVLIPNAAAGSSSGCRPDLAAAPGKGRCMLQASHDLLEILGGSAVNLDVGSSTISSVVMPSPAIEDKLWAGEDVDWLPVMPVETFNRAAHLTTPSSSVNIFGLYNSGTNLLQMLLDFSFRNASICPDTGQSKIRTCRHDTPTSKHANVDYIEREFLPQAREKGIRTLFVIRNPISNLLSMHKLPYSLDSCVGPQVDNWVGTVCSCQEIKHAKHQGDPLCEKDRQNFTSVADVWNTYISGYARLANSGSTPALLIRYEDLVQDPGAVMLRTAHFLSEDSATIPSLKDAMKASAKKSNGIGREAALKKIRTKSYRSDPGYNGGRLGHLCAQLNKTLLDRFGYMDECS